MRICLRHVRAFDRCDDACEHLDSTCELSTDEATEQSTTVAQLETALAAARSARDLQKLSEVISSLDSNQLHEAIAAAEKNLPIIVPGWEDSTMGNIFASYCIKGELKPSIMKSGIEYMVWLADWYRNNSSGKGVGFFQIGGGIAGDFPICVVPLISQDLEQADVKCWSYFCQISDSTTSYGGYSGAVPNEKITWGKLAKETPKFMIESDATIVAPLIFAYILAS